MGASLLSLAKSVYYESLLDFLHAVIQVQHFNTVGVAKAVKKA